MATAMALVSVNNLGTPCHLSIAGGFLIGMLLRIQGSVPKDSNRFQIDFLCGGDRQGETALHFNPRLEEGMGVVILNSFLNKNWTKEEKCFNPFRKGKNFQLEFLITKNSFKMMVNNNYLCQYSHRVLLDKVKSLRVAGDVEVKKIAIFKDSSIIRSTFHELNNHVSGSDLGGIHNKQAVAGKV